MFGLPVAPLLHNIGSGSGNLDEVLSGVGLALIPVLAYALFRLGRWARKADRNRADDQDRESRG